MNSIEKFRSKDLLKIITGALDIVSSLTNLIGIREPYGFVIQNLWAGVNWLLTEGKPSEPNVVILIIILAFIARRIKVLYLYNR